MHTTNLRILVMGLPGSGKTTFAAKLQSMLPNSQHLNADEVRTQFDDWDFSIVGRLRQASRMRELSDQCAVTIADFVCPTEATRKIFDPHIVVWLDTIQFSEYEDTNAVFDAPMNWNFRLWRFIDTDSIIQSIVRRVNKMRPQGVMIGRYQPFHDGHLALFREVLSRTGFVCIMVRDTPKDSKNPFNFREVNSHIAQMLREYDGQYTVVSVPNICGVYYGRDVGYEVEKISLPAEVEAISATRIREGLQ